MFKVDDEVVCVDNDDAGYDLVVGKKYNVMWVGSSTVCVSSPEQMEWNMCRFVLASEYNTEVVNEENNIEAVKPIVSDGGSSEYYKITLVRASDGEEFECEVGDVINALVGDNFQLGNVIKGARRMWCDAQGKGKAGIDMSYDRNKIKYFVDDFVNRYGKKQ